MNSLLFQLQRLIRHLYNSPLLKSSNLSGGWISTYRGQTPPQVNNKMICTCCTGTEINISSSNNSVQTLYLDPALSLDVQIIMYMLLRWLVLSKCFPMESTALVPFPRLFIPKVGSIRFTTSTSHCSFIAASYRSPAWCRDTENKWLINAYQ